MTFISNPSDVTVEEDSVFHQRGGRQNLKNKTFSGIKKKLHKLETELQELGTKLQ